MDKLESYIDGNIVFVSTQFLAAMQNVTPRTVTQWVKKGLPVYKKPNIKTNLFILEDASKWIKENINKAKSNNAKGLGDDEELDIEEENRLFEIYTKGNSNEKKKLLLRLSQTRLDNYKKIEDIIEKEAKNKEYDSKYALVDDVKKGEQELASLMISLLKNSMPVLSKTLENKSQDEIFHDLDRHFKKEMQKIVKYIRKNEDTVVTLNTIIEEIIYMVNEKEMTNEQILKMIKDKK